MNYIKDTIEYLTKIFQWWVIIMPWEKAILIRFGKNKRVISGGTFFRIPFFDVIFKQCTRMRVVNMPQQTITTKDEKTITIVLNIGYSIEDIELLYETLFAAEKTITNIAMGSASEFIFNNILIDATPDCIEKHVFQELLKTKYGLRFTYVKVSGYAVVRTYRLLQDHSWTYNELNTDNRS